MCDQDLGTGVNHAGMAHMLRDFQVGPQLWNHKILIVDLTKQVKSKINSLWWQYLVMAMVVSQQPARLWGNQKVILNLRLLLFLKGASWEEEAVSLHQKKIETGACRDDDDGAPLAIIIYTTTRWVETMPRSLA